jgi:CubicO group peptidase (beta-lactamase class C family)
MLPDGPLLRAANELAIGMGPPSPAAMPAPDTWLRRLGSLPLAHQPGERWQYNTGSDVLGVLVARASGQSFGSFLRERIFEPLGMRDTAFSVPAPAAARFADSYRPTPQGGLALFDAAQGGQWSRAPAFESGAGGLCSTIDDYLAFTHALTQGRLLSSASLQAMTTDQLSPQQKRGAVLSPGYFDAHGWGFGVGIATRDVSAAEPLGTYGWDGGLGTAWRTSPRERLTMIMLSQRMFSSPEPPAHIRDFLRLGAATVA